MTALKDGIAYLVVQKLIYEVVKKYGYLIEIEKKDIKIYQKYSDDNTNVLVIIDGTLGFLLNRPTIKILIPVEYQYGQRISDIELKNLIVADYNNRRI